MARMRHAPIDAHGIKKDDAQVLPDGRLQQRESFGDDTHGVGFSSSSFPTDEEDMGVRHIKIHVRTHDELSFRSLYPLLS